MRPELNLVMNAVAVTTTSDPINIENAKRVTFEFTRTLHSSGSTVFTVLLSLDGVTYVATNMLIDNVTNSNAQTLTRVASATLSSNTSKHYTLDLMNAIYRYMKVVATRTTDGSATVKALVEKPV